MVEHMEQMVVMGSKLPGFGGPGIVEDVVVHVSRDGKAPSASSFQRQSPVCQTLFEGVFMLYNVHLHQWLGCAMLDDVRTFLLSTILFSWKFVRGSKVPSSVCQLAQRPNGVLLFRGRGVGGAGEVLFVLHACAHMHICTALDQCPVQL